MIRNDSMLAMKRGRDALEVAVADSWDPIRAASDAQDTHEPDRNALGAPRTPPKFSLFEREDEYLLQLPVSALPQEALQLEIHGTTLLLRAPMPSFAEEDLARNSGIGTMAHAQLPGDARLEQMQVRVLEGILRVRVPRRR